VDAALSPDSAPQLQREIEKFWARFIIFPFLKRTFNFADEDLQRRPGHGLGRWPPVTRPSGEFLGWLVEKKKITSHIPGDRQDGIFSRSDFRWDRKRGVYICPDGKLLQTTGTVRDGRSSTAPRSRTAMCGRSERSAAPRPMRARFRATYTRTPAMSHGRR
jgi:hypothetical protein